LDATYAVRRRVSERAIAEQDRQKEMVEVVLKRTNALRPGIEKEPPLRLVVLPYLKHDLVQPSKERLHIVEAGFLKLAILAQSMNDAEPRDVQSEALAIEDESQASLTPTLNNGERRFAEFAGAACRTCSGRCCNWGGNGAFLNFDTFREALRSKPGSGPNEIVKGYMDQIPTELFRDSCIFHGLKGCGLARENRSKTCNTYLCSSLCDLRDGINENASAFLLASTNLWEIEESELKVYRVTIATETSTESILTDVADRR